VIIRTGKQPGQLSFIGPCRRAAPKRIHVSQVDGWVRLEIDDTGPGVPAELRDRIFERFARGTRSGMRGTDTGSGLGLALVAEHTRRHGGEVWVEDHPGGGARFVVQLPPEPERPQHYPEGDTA
jgi:signal transduction histidine kinase